ncbi:Predicted dehydrogenase [Mameliella alba]|uniref:Gfo/Idh/MocA family protein n=1 Tax=Mameliella TaxID=1434019 RepID=UPI00087EC964|nr:MULTISPECIES: Gfo/Idh/MocA family oxidoreductase [Mameliella]MBV6636145.1 Gfo/Idh/MocA family oxidoreductase [Mameliella sp.]MCR9273306.1 Gfo/Idh/MocA family oxidoreductase [Paracoccaceae bacterium]OWV48156.1 gfo/Idh/MocA family oxidoreductase [Mameliella alba]OWV58244.1 gfo/Idh/MocA family oxidoreductase [Mameliella alba]PTR40189.1 putative dehydrogenase [Mameliella alba]
MTDHVRWGILGAAKFAREHMGPAIHMGRRGRLAALATSSPDKAAPFAALAPGLTVHDSYDALLADPGIDAVYIPLPNHLHVEWALKALEAGKHVLVEKPLAMTAAEFDPVIAKRDETGLLAAEAYMIVHHPQWHKASQLYQEGAIGKLVRVSAAFSYDNRADGQNIRNRPDTGGGAVPDIGVYIYGATRFVTGEEPDEILSAVVERENDVDVWTHITARFPSFHYTGVVSMRMAPWQEVVFHGEEGVMKLTAPFNAGVYGEARVTVQSKDLVETVHRFPADNHYVHQVEAFNTSVLDKAHYPCPLEFSRGTQAMIDMVWAKERG